MSKIGCGNVADVRRELKTVPPSLPTIRGGRGVAAMTTK
jgi:hypothetical protein